jgi:hypothetical protein
VTAWFFGRDGGGENEKQRGITELMKNEDEDLIICGRIDEATR